MQQFQRSLSPYDIVEQIFCICYTLFLEIKEYQDADCEAVALLFYNTTHKINAKNYMAEQFTAWASNPNKFTFAQMQKNLI